MSKPTVKELIATLKNEFDLEIKMNEIDQDMYDMAIKGHERGLSLRSMANRIRFNLVGKKNDADKEVIKTRGVFLGSSDIVSDKKPLGKNKSQSIFFLEEGDDGLFRPFTDPRMPSHFKGFKKDVFGKLVECDMVITGNDKGSFVSPDNITVIDAEFVLDTSKVVAYDNVGVIELDKYTPCAVVGTISSIKPLRVPVWEQDNYDDDDYPLTVNDNPVFCMYLNADENEPVIKGVCLPTNLGRPYIEIEDFDVMWDEEFDIEDDISPTFVGRQVIIFGKTKTPSDVGDATFMDFDVCGIVEVGGEPNIVSGTPKKSAEKPAAKEDDSAAKEKAKVKKRKALVKESVTAMMGETTVDIVRSMHDKKFFVGVSDDEIQGWIDAEMTKQGIEQETEDEDVWD
jgi:hypothetical protein